MVKNTNIHDAFPRHYSFLTEGCPTFKLNDFLKSPPSKKLLLGKAHFLSKYGNRLSTCLSLIFILIYIYIFCRVNIGLFCSTPGVALARAVPRKVAMQMLLTGYPISADGKTHCCTFKKLIIVMFTHYQKSKFPHSCFCHTFIVVFDIQK